MDDRATGGGEGMARLHVEGLNIEVGGLKWVQP